MDPADENFDPLHVLLPVYTKAKQDVFLEILKKVVSRTKIGDNYLDSAFIVGLSAETLLAEFEDVSVSEISVHSKEQETRISKLLGFWAANNFPSLGKKLLGEKWRPHDGRTITVGNKEILTPNELDALILKKMKLRVIQLQVGASTRAKMKHFIAVPSNVCQNNAVKISRKMNELDIKESLMENCWLALKCGKFSTSDDFEQQSEMDDGQIESRNIELNADVLSVSTAEQVIVDVDVSDLQLPSRAKRARVDIGVNVSSGHSDLANDDMRTAIQKMGDDISQLTKWFNPEAALAVSHKQIEANKQKFLQLEKGLEESSCENEKVRDQLNEMKKYSEVVKKNLDDTDCKKLELESENEMLREELKKMANCNGEMKKNLGDSDRKNVELMAENKTLREEFKKISNDSEELKKNWFESDCARVQSIEENKKLCQEIIELKKSFDAMVLILETQIESIEKSTIQAEDTGKGMSHESADTMAKQLLTGGADDGGTSNTSALSSETPLSTDASTSQSDREPAFETDDSIVRESRSKLAKLPFGWVKFRQTKKSKFSPAFVHPPDPDGKMRAEEVSADGYTCSIRREFFDFKKTLDDAERDTHQSEISALKKFNKKFNFSFE